MKTDYQEEFTNKHISFCRKSLKEKLMECTDKQIQLFNRMYGSIEEIEPHKMKWAYNQVMSTLNENNKTTRIDAASLGEIL